MMSVSIESAEKEDAMTLAEICKRAFESDHAFGAPGSGGPPGYDSPEAQVSFMRFLDYYKILLDDKIVGGIMAGSAGEGHKVMERIFVDPEFHRQGIGTRAFQLLWELYPLVNVWTLGTPEWNVRTKNFYEKLGFIQVGWDLGVPAWRGRWYQKVMNPDNPIKMLKIKELRDGMRTVTAEGKILEMSEPRMVHSRKKDETLTVVNAAMRDETGRVVLVLWNEQIQWVNVGDNIRVENGYTTSYMGVLQLNVGTIGRLIVLI